MRTSKTIVQAKASNGHSAAALIPALDAIQKAAIAKLGGTREDLFVGADAHDPLRSRDSIEVRYAPGKACSQPEFYRSTSALLSNSLLTS
jgi:hypothetical protein